MLSQFLYKEKDLLIAIVFSMDTNTFFGYVTEFISRISTPANVFEYIFQILVLNNDFF